MKYLNIFSVLLLVVLFSFQACVQEDLVQTEAEIFKSLDQLPTDHRFVNLLLESINLTNKANHDQLDRAKELIDQGALSVEEQIEIAAIIGFKSWDAYTAYSQKKQEMLKELNAEYNLTAYEAQEIMEYSTQVRDYIMENSVTPRNDDLVVGGPVVGGPVVDPCIQDCNDSLLDCLVANGLGHLIEAFDCLFVPPGESTILCEFGTILRSIRSGAACSIGYGFCVAFC